MSIDDTPSLIATDTPSLTVNTVTDSVDYFGIIHSFDLYFGVRTTETTNGANHVYTQRAHGAWRFDGSGNIVWQGQPPQPTWQGGGPGNNAGSGTFDIITNGSVVPVTTGPALNSFYANETWSTVPQ